MRPPSSDRFDVIDFLLLVGLAITLTAMVVLMVNQASAHDVYRELRSPTGQLCCGGDPVTGDCEAVNYQVNPDGSATFQSRRYGASVLIGASKITWLPVPGGEAFEAHWCGVPRTKVQLAPFTDENPDPTFWTYCAFIAPGGV